MRKKLLPAFVFIFVAVICFSVALLDLPFNINRPLFMLSLGVLAFSALGGMAIDFAFPPVRNVYSIFRLAAILLVFLFGKFTFLALESSFFLDAVWLIFAGMLFIDRFHIRKSIVLVAISLLCGVMALFSEVLPFVYFLFGTIAFFVAAFHDDGDDAFVLFGLSIYALIVGLSCFPKYGGLRFGAFVSLWIVLFGALRPLMARLRHIKQENDAVLRRELELTRIEEKALKEEIRPHFLLNALNNVRVAYHENKEKGRAMLERLIRLEQLIGEVSESPVIPIAKEVEIIKGLIALFESERGKSVILDVELEDPECLIPPMLLEPLVENSLQHSGIFAQKDGTISIRQSTEYGFVLIEVADNGTGHPLLSPNRGIGLSNVKTRVELLEEGHMDIVSDESGTTIALRFLAPPLTL